MKWYPSLTKGQSIPEKINGSSAKNFTDVKKMSYSLNYRRGLKQNELKKYQENSYDESYNKFRTCRYSCKTV